MKIDTTISITPRQIISLSFIHKQIYSLFVKFNNNILHLDEKKFNIILYNPLITYFA